MKSKTIGKALRSDFRLNKYKYLIVLPVIVYFAIFAYKPMYGLIIAFKDYRPALGLMDSPWANPWYKQFLNWFTDPFFYRVMRNTFSISLLSIIFGFPAPILLALLINEIRNAAFKRTVQTITYMPYFISLVVVCSLIRTYVGHRGIFSEISMALGGEAKNFLMYKEYFYTIFISSDIWQFIGWNSIIYLAAITGIDQEQYEAARVDGANRLQHIFLITLPNLMPIITILFILRIGSILNVSFEKVLLLYNSSTYEVSDIISTYVYRRGLGIGSSPNYSFGAAVGLFNSAVNLFFLLTANFISRRFSGNSLF